MPAKSAPQRALIILVLVVLVGVLLLTTHDWGSAGKLKAAFDAEFLTRPDGYEGLSEAYGFTFADEPRQMDPGLMYKSASMGTVDVICAFATDGRIAAYDLAVLEDDKGFFPPYYAAPLVRAETLEKHPEIKDILGKLTGRISDEKMREMNYDVDENRRSAREVAREFLVSEGLIEKDAKPGDGSGGAITIGGKQFTEQEILGQMMAIIIECNSDIEVTRKLNLAGTMVCFTALKSGDLDLYAEYTGTGLVSILKEEVISDPDKAYDFVKRAFKEEYNLVWLGSLGFNNTYTITMRGDQAKALDIDTISDLAAYINAKKNEGAE